jgi:hypothetical protein
MLQEMQKSNMEKSMTHKLSPEAEKARDEKAKIEGKKAYFGDYNNYAEGYPVGFNEGYSTAHEELAGKTVSAEDSHYLCDSCVADFVGTNIKGCPECGSDNIFIGINDHQQTSLIYEAKIARLESQNDYLRTSMQDYDERLNKAIEALRTLKVAVNDKVNDPGATAFIARTLAEIEGEK